MKATLKNERGKYFSVELNGDVYQLYHDLRDNGLNMPPHRIPIKFGTVSLTSDSELEQNMIRLFRETDSLDDVVTMLTVVRDMREDIRPKFEQWMLSNLYSNKDEVYEHIRELKVALASDRITFYCHLEGNIYNNEFCELVPCDESLLVESQSKIETLLENEQLPDCDMARFVGNQSGLGERLILAEWSVKEVDGTLYGKIDCYLDGAINDSELEKLRETLIGQNSDGFGEGFEQRPIKTEDGELYVSFWNSGDDYFLKTSSEFEQYLRHHSLSTTYPNISRCTDAAYLYEQLDSDELEMIERVIAEYNSGKITLEIPRHDNGEVDFDGEWNVIECDTSRERSYEELVILKWYESFENTDFMVDTVQTAFEQTHDFRM